MDPFDDIFERITSGSGPMTVPDAGDVPPIAALPYPPHDGQPAVLPVRDLRVTDFEKPAVLPSGGDTVDGRTTVETEPDAVKPLNLRVGFSKTSREIAKLYEDCADYSSKWFGKADSVVVGADLLKMFESGSPDILYSFFSTKGPLDKFTRFCKETGEIVRERMGFEIVPLPRPNFRAATAERQELLLHKVLSRKDLYDRIIVFKSTTLYEKLSTVCGDKAVLCKSKSAVKVARDTTFSTERKLILVPYDFDEFFARERDLEVKVKFALKETSYTHYLGYYLSPLACLRARSYASDYLTFEGRVVRLVDKVGRKTYVHRTLPAEVESWLLGSNGFAGSFQHPCSVRTVGGEKEWINSLFRVLDTGFRFIANERTRIRDGTERGIAILGHLLGTIGFSYCDGDSLINEHLPHSAVVKIVENLELVSRPKGSPIRAQHHGGFYLAPSVKDSMCTITYTGTTMGTLIVVRTDDGLYKGQAKVGHLPEGTEVVLTGYARGSHAAGMWLTSYREKLNDKKSHTRFFRPSETISLFGYLDDSRASLLIKAQSAVMFIEGPYKVFVGEGGIPKDLFMNRVEKVLVGGKSVLVKRFPFSGSGYYPDVASPVLIQTLAVKRMGSFVEARSLIESDVPPTRKTQLILPLVQLVDGDTFLLGGSILHLLLHWMKVGKSIGQFGNEFGKHWIPIFKLT